MSQKRKAQYSQPATSNQYNNNNHHQHKKARTENGHNPNKINGQSHRKAESLPAIPPITPALEKAVFTHQGMGPASTTTTTQELTYDRLEFLGDAYIEVIATRLIWATYQSLPAGRMSQIRELLVKNETLYEYAVGYAFDKRLRAQDHVLQQQQREDAKRWLKVVADVFEAYVAAVVLSDAQHGFRLAEEWLGALWAPKLRDVKAAAPNLRAKEELARKVLARGIKLNYRDEAPMQQLKGGLQTYFIGVYLTGWGWEDRHLGSGTGLSKVAAGNEAAARALEDAGVMAQIAERRSRYLEEQQAERERAEAQKDGVDKDHD